MFLELGENLASRFCYPEAHLTLSHLHQKIPNLVEINVALNLKVGQY